MRERVSSRADLSEEKVREGSLSPCHGKVCQTEQDGGGVGVGG